MKLNLKLRLTFLFLIFFSEDILCGEIYEDIGENKCECFKKTFFKFIKIARCGLSINSASGEILGSSFIPCLGGSACSSFSSLALAGVGAGFGALTTLSIISTAAATTYSKFNSANNDIKRHQTLFITIAITSGIIAIATLMCCLFHLKRTRMRDQDFS